MKVKILIYDKEKNRYQSECTLDLISVPQVGNKLVYAPGKDKPANVYNVDEVRFGDYELVDICVHFICSLTDYNCRLVSIQNSQ